MNIDTTALIPGFEDSGEYEDRMLNREAEEKLEEAPPAPPRQVNPNRDIFQVREYKLHQCRPPFGIFVFETFVQAHDMAYPGDRIEEWVKTSQYTVPGDVE